MAILSKIRGWSIFLVIIIGLPLLFFVVDPQVFNNFFDSKKTNFVGNVSGEDIPREEFISRVDDYKTRRGNINDTQASKAVWDILISEKIYDTQCEKAGIVIGEKEVWEAIINDPSVKNNPEFSNEAGLFDEELLKFFITELKDDTSIQGRARWKSWLNFERETKKNLERNTYLNLVKSGLNVTEAEGKRYYFLNNTNITGKYVLLPFKTIPDSTVQISKSDMEEYIETYKKEFQVKESRSLQYVKFELSASETDKEAILKELTDLIEDKEEYSSITKTQVKVTGLKNTKDPANFLAENSDTPYDDNFVAKNSLNSTVADNLFALKVNEIYGPYEDGNYFKLSKVIDKKPIPSVVQASHILVAYRGAFRANPEITRTKEEAETRAKSILSLVKRTGTVFAEVAKAESDGPSAFRGGNLGWVKKGDMTPVFNDWIFSNKKGQIGMVETEFGYHIIKIFNVKSEPGIKLATVSKFIVPSEETERKVFIEAESFSASTTKGQNFTDLAKEKNYQVKKALKLERSDDAISGLSGNNRQIVIWAFDDKTKVGNIQRFDIDKAYVVAQITQREVEGLQTVENATSKVRPLVINDKKTEILTKKLQDGSLDDISKKENIHIRNTGELNFESPSSGLGKTKAVVGAMLGMQEGELIRGIRGSDGVYAVELTKKTLPIALDSYEAYRIQLENKLVKDNTTIFNALKEDSNIKDYR